MTSHPTSVSDLHLFFCVAVSLHSNFRRYFYINTHTGESQWDYPEGNAVDSSSSGGKKMRKVRGSKKKVKAMGPEPGIIPVVEATLAVSTGVAMSQSGVEEDLDGVAMADDDVGNLEVSTKSARVQFKMVFMHF